MAKRIVTAFIEQVIEFDTEVEYECYLFDLKMRKPLFCIKDVKKDESGKVIVTIRKQYNKKCVPGCIGRK